MLFFTAELEINFDLVEYSFTEGEASVLEIKVQFMRTQNPFNLALYPVSDAEAIDRFHVVNFIGESPHRDIERATSGI